MALMPQGLSLEPAWLQTLEPGGPQLWGPLEPAWSQTLEPRLRWRPGLQQLAPLADWMALMPQGLSLGPAWLQTLEPGGPQWWGPLEPAWSQTL